MEVVCYVCILGCYLVQVRVHAGGLIYCPLVHTVHFFCLGVCVVRCCVNLLCIVRCWFCFFASLGEFCLTLLFACFAYVCFVSVCFYFAHVCFAFVWITFACSFPVSFGFRWFGFDNFLLITSIFLCFLLSFLLLGFWLFWFHWLQVQLSLFYVHVCGHG